MQKSRMQATQDFFLFCDPPATPAFAFLLTGAAAAVGGISPDTITAGRDSVSHAACLAAGGSSDPGTGSPAHFTLAVAASAAVAVGPTEIFLSVTLGPTAGFNTQHSFEAAAGPLASTGCSSLPAAGSAADTAAAGSTAAGAPSGTPTSRIRTSADSASLTSLTIVTASAAGAAATARGGWPWQLCTHQPCG